MSECELKSVKYTIPYIYLHLSLLGGIMPDPWGTSRYINWGVDNITGVQPPNPPTILTLTLQSPLTANSVNTEAHSDTNILTVTCSKERQWFTKHNY